MLETAISLASKAHEGQVDKGGMPYILHPLRVMQKFFDTDHMIVAVLHDVVEDTDITFSDLEKIGFDVQIIRALVCLTKKENEAYDQFIDRVSKNKIATAVKIEDIKDNMDLTRLTEIQEKDLVRFKKYHQALKYLKSSIGARPQF